MTGIQHILSPMAASWTAWLMLVIGVVLGLFLARRRDFGQTLLSSLAASSERQYNATVGLVPHLVLMTLFVLELALVFDLWWYNGLDFAFVQYIRLVGVMTVIVVAQWLLSTWVRWVFVPVNVREALYQQRISMLCILSMLAYAALLLLLNFPIRSVVLGFMVVLMVFLVLGSLWGGVRLYAKGISSLALVLLYVVFLQIIPILGFIEYSKFVVS